jgi:hypothetical protein
VTANVPKTTGASNMQGVHFVISLSTAFALGCSIPCEKAALLMHILYKDQNVKGFKNRTNQSSRI